MDTIGAIERRVADKPPATPPAREFARALAVVVAAVTWVGAAAPARAWYAHEHERLGAAGYRAACAKLAADVADHADPQVARRLARACRGRLDTTRAGESLAAHYGRACSFADFVPHPPDGATAAQIAAVDRWSRPHLLFAVLWEKPRDGPHFHPAARERFTRHHGQALRAAIAAARCQDCPGAFAEAFYLSALADHFAQDAFATGHMGFDRERSTAAAARLFHNMGGDAGRWLRSGVGETWLGYGDGHLCADGSGAEWCARVYEASAVTIYRVLSTYVTGVARFAAAAAADAADAAGSARPRWDATPTCLLPVAATAPRALAGFDGATSHPPPGERPAADAFVSLAAPMRRARIQSALRVDYEAALGGGRAFGLFFTERAVGGAYLRAGVGARLDASVDDSELLADVVGAYPLSFARGLLSVAPELGARVSLSEPARSGGRVGARVTFEAAWLLVGGQVHYELSSTAQDWWFGGFVGLVVGARGGGPQ